MNQQILSISVLDCCVYTLIPLFVILPYTHNIKNGDRTESKPPLDCAIFFIDPSQSVTCISRVVCHIIMFRFYMQEMPKNEPRYNMSPIQPQRLLVIHMLAFTLHHLSFQNKTFRTPIHNKLNKIYLSKSAL